MTLQERIDEAEVAYHKLVTGNAPRVFVDQNGERVEYVMAQAPRLKAYIAALRTEKASEGSTKTNSGPLRPVF